jgi:type II secretory pathway pseudopilin PulG
MSVNRPGLSLVEIAVAVVVVLLLAGAALPGLVAPRDRARVDRAVLELYRITDAMSTMRGDNQDWPGRVSHLARPIVVGERNVCGDWSNQGTYGPGKVNNWAGPYIDRMVPAAGLDIGIGVVQDSVVREPLQGNNAYLVLEIHRVSEEDAIELSRRVDGNVSATEGTVQWSPADAAGLVRVEYRRPIRGC